VPATPCRYDAGAVAALRAEPLGARTKGVPRSWLGRTTAQVVGERVTSMPTPRVTLDAGAVDHNLSLMADWCAQQAVRLAPHGKTTMAPQLFARQIDLGAWAITAATMAQVMVMRSVGITRVLLANQLVDPVAIDWLAAELRDSPELELLCFVDSVPGVRLLDEGLDGVPGRVRVLLEVGLPGGRAGCRTAEEAYAVASAVRNSGSLTLAGVAGWEGAYGNGLDDASRGRVDALLRTMRTTTTELYGAGFFAGAAEVLVTAGGSAYFDQVVEVLTEPWALGVEVAVVLRSGAYVTHDHQHYQHLSPFGDRGTDRVLRPALTAWGRVLSLPEPGFAILDLGKRDVSYDLDLPTPLVLHRDDGTAAQLEGATATAINDQHLFVAIDPGLEPAVGDIVQLGLSHPCTVFDKWQLLPVIDEQGRVVDLVRTYF
jgi:D-serine deaminase-like pyridoxal phosphate-dependent protein